MIAANRIRVAPTGGLGAAHDGPPRAPPAGRHRPFYPLVEGDALRRRCAEARDAVAAWTDSHFRQQRVNGLLSIDRKPTELVALEVTVASSNTELASFERGATDAAHSVAALDARIAATEADRA